MKIYTEPKVWLVSTTKLAEELFDKAGEIAQYLPGFDEWLAKAIEAKDKDGEIAVELGGRNCYHSWNNPAGRTNREYIQNIIMQQHYSVLEHGFAGFLIFANREITHEMVRHRHQSPSQESTRYVSYGEGEKQKEPTFVVPEMFLEDPNDKVTVERYLRAVMDMYNWAHENAAERYDKIQDRTMKRKLARQAARGALPHWLSATIMVTGNYRAWLEALPKRLSYHADIGIRKVYLQILDKLEDEAPNIFRGLFERKTWEDGTTYAVLSGSDD